MPAFARVVRIEQGDQSDKLLSGKYANKQGTCLPAEYTCPADEE